MIYLDNAATSFPKPKCVYKAVDRCIRNYCGNPGRSSHRLSIKSAEKIFSARESVSGFLGCKYPENVVFTYNATYALNLAIKGIINSDCHIITSFYEHNSVIRPLAALKKKYNISISKFENTDNPEIEIENLIRSDTKAIICSVASNVTGDQVDLSILSKIARKYDVCLIVDGSQAVGHKKFDLSVTPCDVFCAPGHKSLFGIQGCGFAVFKDKTRRNCIVEGGSGLESENTEMPLLLPEGYEPGTLGTPSIVALESGINYINQVGIEEIEKHLTFLLNELYIRLSSVKDIEIYKFGNGILSFNISNIDSQLVSSMLDRVGICTRAGLHCAPDIHRRLGTIYQGAVRISLSHFNSLKDIDRLWHEIKCIRDNLI